MKSYLISDNRDTIIGMRLANIEGVLAQTREEIIARFKEAVEDKDIGIIIITEKIFEEMKEEVLELKRTGSSQLIVTIPDRTGLKDKNFIMRYIKESIGIKI
ncbi:V-type ATP synthase subunit F [Gudongella oleilytica]|uniref:V-type ATP synthase subunit F n=1 Tax=Gudongella oleilytica TaxID=1582259 RepID=UPI000FF88F51|nr:V-type ATP synthase subunit F [Gudongella oleilytica]